MTLSSEAPESAPIPTPHPEEPAPPALPHPARDASILPWLILLLALLATGAIRWRLREIPLERDEGEYAVMGRMLLEGTPPYAEAYSMKLPGIYAVYAGIMAVFGDTDQGIRTGLLLAGACTSVLLFLLGRRIAGPWAGLAAGVLYSVTALLPSLHGLWANAEPFVVLFATAGALALHAALESRKPSHFLWAGVLLALAPLVKQQGLFFAAFGMGCVLSCDRSWGRSRWYALGWLVAGLLLPLGLLLLWLREAGVWDRFWTWAVRYAWAYAGEVSWTQAPMAFWRGISRSIWALAPAALLALWGLALAPARERRLVRFFFAASCLCVCPGWLFRPHYFGLCLPGLALAAGVGLAEGLERFRGRSGALRALPAAWGLLAGLLPLALSAGLLLGTPPDLLSWKVFGPCPFPEAKVLGEWIRERADPEARIGVFGSEPELCFYARRRPASGYLYMYPLLEEQPYAAEMQADFMREMERARPELAVLVHTPDSWGWKMDQENPVMVQANNFLQGRYAPVGLATLHFPKPTRYDYGESDVRRQGLHPKFKYWVAVYEWKPALAGRFDAPEPADR